MISKALAPSVEPHIVFSKARPSLDVFVLPPLTSSFIFASCCDDNNVDSVVMLLFILKVGEMLDVAMESGVVEVVVVVVLIGTEVKELATAARTTSASLTLFVCLICVVSNFDFCAANSV